jgi:phosphatidylglycerol lysyltransferase
MTAVLDRPGRIGAERQEHAPVMPERPAGSFPEDQPRRRLPLPGLGWRQFRRAPATICYLAAVWVAGLVTGSIAHGPPRWLSGHIGAGLPSLGHGYWWTPLSAALWASGPGGYLAITVLGLLILAPAERRMGVLRTFTALLVSQAAGLLLAAGLIKLAGLAREPWLSTLTGETAVGALPGVLGVGFALSCTLTLLWRRRLRLLLTVAVTISALCLGHLEQVAQACGATAGLVTMALMYGRARTRAGRRASRHEVRVLVAVLVAVSALGGMLAVLVADPDGPMSLFSFLFAARGPNPRALAALCAHAGPAVACHSLRERQLYTRWPGVAVRAAPGLLLLLSADGLRRGRRLAWWLAVAIDLTVLGASIWATRAACSRVHTAGSGAGTPAVVLAGEAMLLPVVTLIMLLVTRRRFDQTADGRAVRKLMATLTIALGASCAAFLLLGYLLRDHFSPRPGIGALARDLPARFLAGRLPGNRFLPADLAGRLLYVWVFLLFWIVVLGALTAFFLHSPAYRDADAAGRARAILTRGGSTLSYMSTWPGNQYWFSPDGRAAVAYRVIAAVAVTVGGPYGDPAALDSAITGFARFCEHRGLQPCLYGVTAQARAVTQRLGWQSVQIAEDTLLPLERLQFTGKKWQDVRTALNKAAKEGITAQWWTYPQAPPNLAGQIRQISQTWMADKGLPEMGFTLGGLDQLNDPDIRCLIAVGADGKVHGITSWMPVYASGRPVGWTLDFMRRNTEPGTFRGVMEFLIATAALTLRAEGARFVSLSGAPLARLDRGERPSVLQCLLDRIADTMEPVYGFQSLLHFKAKFQPVYQPLYLTYPDPAALGSIATAIGRAYLPHLTARQALRLLTRLRWPRANRGRLAAPPRSGPARGDLLEPASGIEPLTCRLPVNRANHAL